MARCVVCGKSSKVVSSTLSVCLECIRKRFDSVSSHIADIHANSRKEFKLPLVPPKSEGGIECGLCSNDCRIAAGERGYCGVRSNESGTLVSEDGILDWYHDPLPTNCVADWVCAGGSPAGYPQYSYRQEAEFGYENLAVFYRACSFNCLYCQNWHFKQTTGHSRVSPEELAARAGTRTSCICYFGGDPAPQMDHAIRTSELARASNPDRILRICWETNGTMGKPSLQSMLHLSLLSGGCLKFNLKAFTEELNLALCGASNQSTLRNFEYAASFCKERRDPPLLVASTLLVPGYVDLDEVRSIARFVAELDRDIPYVLLGFHPHFLMKDLPRTSRDHAYRALAAAQDEGLRRVRVGNMHLLSDSYGTAE